MAYYLKRGCFYFGNDYQWHKGISTAGLFSPADVEYLLNRWESNGINIKKIERLKGC